MKKLCPVHETELVSRKRKEIQNDLHEIEVSGKVRTVRVQVIEVTTVERKLRISEVE